MESVIGNYRMPTNFQKDGSGRFIPSKLKIKYRVLRNMIKLVHFIRP